MIDGRSYQVPTTQELKKVSNHIRKTLGLGNTSKFTTDADTSTTDGSTNADGTTPTADTTGGNNGYGY